MKKRVEKILIDKNIVYFEHLIKASGNKDVIDQEMLERCEESVKAIKSCEKSIELLRSGDQAFELIEVFNEKPLDYKNFRGLPFGIKGIIDNFVIDHTTKTVFINDIKTTQKTLSDFPESIEYFKYWLQAAIYIELIKGNLRDNEKDYEIIFHFIVVDKYNHVYPFPVTNRTLRQWKLDMEEVLKKAEYHYKNKEYKLPYQFALENVKL